MVVDTAGSSLLDCKPVDCRPVDCRLADHKVAVHMSVDLLDMMAVATPL